VDVIDDLSQLLRIGIRGSQQQLSGLGVGQYRSQRLPQLVRECRYELSECGHATGVSQIELQLLQLPGIVYLANAIGT
jgi:hypothetical protein